MVTLYSTPQSYEARLRSRWQTFLGTSVISVPPTDRYASGFIVAVMIEGEGEMCGESEFAEEGNSTLVYPRRKSVRIMVAPTDTDVTNAVVVVLLFYALTCLVCHPYFAQALVRFQTPLKGIQMKSRAGLEKAKEKLSNKRGALLDA